MNVQVIQRWTRARIKTPRFVIVILIYYNYFTEGGSCCFDKIRNGLTYDGNVWTAGHLKFKIQNQLTIVDNGIVILYIDFFYINANIFIFYEL